jgi:hypothetical protein
MTSLFNLAGKAALVTGGNGGLIGGELPDDIFVFEFGVRGLQGI